MLLTAARMFGVRGHHTRAAELSQRAAAALLSRVPINPEPFEDAVALAFLSLRRMKRHDAILRWLEPVVASLRRIDPQPLRSIAYVLHMMGESYMATGKLAKAEAVVRQSLQLTEDEYGFESEQMQVLYTNLATLLKKQKRALEAQEAERKAQQIAEALETQAYSPLTTRRRGLA